MKFVFRPTIRRFGLLAAFFLLVQTVIVTTVGVASAQVGSDLEAEDALVSGASIFDGRGSNGGSYVDFTTASDQYVEWTVSIDSSGNHSLIFRYALGASTSRTMSVSVNGSDIGEVEFTSTGSWTTWGTASIIAPMLAGSNTIRLIAAGDSGPNVDSLLLAQADTGSSNSSGVWGPVIPIGLVPVAMSNLPSGDLLMWSAYDNLNFGGNGGYTQTARFNPTTGNIQTREVRETQHDFFCPGIANMADGRVLIAGGAGNAETSIYNPATDDWEDAADMNIGRGYQSNVTTGDGSVLTVGGSWSGGAFAKDSEIYRNGNWSTLSGMPGGLSLLTNDSAGIYRADNHMWLFAWEGNRVFHAGPSKTIHWLGPDGEGSITNLGLRGDDDHAMNGNAVMYDSGKILTTGGAPDYNNSPGTANAHVIDLNVTPPAVRRVASMDNRRTLHTSVVLPSGEVVVIGGQNVSRLFTDEQAVLVAEMFDPDTETWTTLAPMSVPRTYHSASILLQDARVLTGGGGLCGSCETNHPDVQILTPPYLLDSSGNLKARPTINSSPERVSYGASMEVNVSGGDGGAAEFALVRNGNSTHTVNNGQRRILLTSSEIGGDSHQLDTPSDPGVAPPGAYMLFALDSVGTPSVAATIYIQ